MERVPIRVLIVEDDDDFAYLIRDQLTRQGDMEVVGRARDRRGALALAQSLEPQVVLMDLSLSAAQMDGVEAARDIRIATGAKVVILTVYEDPKVVLEASIPQAAPLFQTRLKSKKPGMTVMEAAPGSLKTARAAHFEPWSSRKMNVARRSVFKVRTWCGNRRKGGRLSLKRVVPWEGTVVP